jgi:hypothetical protein
VKCESTLDLEDRENTKMSNSMIRRTNIVAIPALIVLSATLACSRAAAQGGAAVPVQVPAEPAGGIDPSKMPDVIGIHLGMPVQEVVDKLKPLFPPGIGDHGLHPAYAKFGHAPAPAFISTLYGHEDNCGNNECAEIMNVVFNTPPNKQIAVSIDRNLTFQAGKQPTPDTIKTALLQKYGPNPYLVTTAPLTLAWIYNEEGQTITPPKGKDQVRCAGTVSDGAPGGPSLTNAAPEYGLTGTQPLTTAFVADMMRNPCRVGVYVLAFINAAGQTVQNLDIKISDNSEATRDAIAEQQYLDVVAAGQQQQQLNKAQQQPPPKF